MLLAFINLSIFLELCLFVILFKVWVAIGLRIYKSVKGKFVKTRISVKCDRSSLHLCNENNALHPAQHTVCIDYWGEEKPHNSCSCQRDHTWHKNVTKHTGIKQENNASYTPFHYLPLDSTVVVSFRVFWRQGHVSLCIDAVIQQPARHWRH